MAARVGGADSVDVFTPRRALSDVSLTNFIILFEVFAFTLSFNFYY